MVDEIANHVSYPDQLTHTQALAQKLAKHQPAVMKAFSSLHTAGACPGSLDEKTKELIALAVAVCVRCDGCIAYHTHDALKAGATTEEIFDALGVAILMGGGPSMIYATHVVEAIEQFTRQSQEVSPASGRSPAAERTSA